MEENHAGTACALSQEGDEGKKARFAALYRANVAEVYQYLHRRCRDTELAEDLTHDVFVQVIRSTRPIAEIGTGWLITAAEHRLIDVARRRDRYSTRLRLLRGGLDGAAIDREPLDRIVLEEAMEGLSIDHRLVLSLHYLDGMTVAQLAEHLGRSEKSVEGLITRARRSLQRELEQSDA